MVWEEDEISNRNKCIYIVNWFLVKMFKRFNEESELFLIKGVRKFSIYVYKNESRFLIL